VCKTKEKKILLPFSKLWGRKDRSQIRGIEPYYLLQGMTFFAAAAAT